MKAVGSMVHPWYKGTHEWQVKNIAQLLHPIKYVDPEQGNVRYDPKIILLENEEMGKVLWFPYWMATSKTENKMKWGQRPPILEEDVFLELIKSALKEGIFSKKFKERLKREL